MPLVKAWGYGEEEKREENRRKKTDLRLQGPHFQKQSGNFAIELMGAQLEQHLSISENCTIETFTHCRST